MAENFILISIRIDAYGREKLISTHKSSRVRFLKSYEGRLDLKIKKIRISGSHDPQEFTIIKCEFLMTA